DPARGAAQDLARHQREPRDRGRRARAPGAFAGPARGPRGADHPLLRAGRRRGDVPERRRRRGRGPVRLRVLQQGRSAGGGPRDVEGGGLLVPRAARAGPRRGAGLSRRGSMAEGPMGTAGPLADRPSPMIDEAAPAAGAGPRRAGSSLGLRLLSVALVLGLWEWGGRIPISLAFPTCSETVAALAAMLVDGTLLAAYADTIRPLIIGLVLCGLGAATAGIAMGLSRTMEWFGLPVFDILQAAPSAAIIPVISYVYGIGLAAKVFAVVLLAAPVIVLNSYKGIRHTSPSLLEMSRAFLANRRQQIFKIILPSASGLIFAGMRLGAAQGFTGVILAELLITPTGVGDLITYYRSIADYPRMFASILSIIVLASVAINLLQRIEETVFRPELRQA